MIGYRAARWFLAGLFLASVFLVQARELEEVRQTGVLRHLGIPYANFVTGSGDGLDVELMPHHRTDAGKWFAGSLASDGR